MTEEQFALFSTAEKWEHLKQTMNYITSVDNIYSIRRRLNPHHLKEDQKKEQRNLRSEQYQRWSHVKNLYAEHRDELANTLENPDYEKCKSIFERIFTTELDDALRSTLGE